MTIDEATALILTELDRAKEKHPVYPTDIMRQVMLVLEEAGEIAQAVNDLEEGKGTMEDVIREAAHTGAMVIRFLINQKDGVKYE